MANRFWTGGTGTWDTADTSHWAVTSGGAPGASAPTSTDNVIFDTASGLSGATITCNGAVCNDLTSSTGVSYTITNPLSVYGSLTGESGITWTGNTVTFRATASGKTITTAGSTFGFLQFKGIGGGWTLQDDLTITNEFYVENGTFNAGNKNLTVGAVYIYADSGFNPTVIMGSGTWTVTGGYFEVDGFAGNAATITSNSSLIKFTDSSSASTGFYFFTDAGTRAQTFNNVWFARGASVGIINISGNLTFSDLKDTGVSAHSILFETGTTTTCSTFTVSGSLGKLITITSGNGNDVLSTGTHTLTKSGGGTVTCQYVNIQHSIATPSNTWFTDYVTSIDNNSVPTAGSGWNFRHVWIDIPKATGSWTNINKASGTSWSKITKATGTSSGVTGGSPIGLLLALTYAGSSGVSIWHNITKASATNWTDITKPAGTTWNNITKAI